MKNQKIVFKSGNEVASIACKQINYHIMGYYPITPSTQIAETLSAMKADGLTDINLIAAEGEHSSAGICYGASVGGGRVFNATSSNGLLYSLEQLPVQSGTRFPMVLNVSCRTVSGPLSIKCDHSDLMYALNTGWLILFAKNSQEVYDFNLIGLKLAEKMSLPIIIAYDGFLTSHQKKKTYIFENDDDVLNFLSKYNPKYTALDVNNPVTIGSYMNEPDLINNKYQLHIAMQEAKNTISPIFEEYSKLTNRKYSFIEEYLTNDAEVIIFALGSSFDTITIAVDELREQGKKVGAFTLKVLRPWNSKEIYNICKNTKALIICDRQDSYSTIGGNMSTEIKASLQEYNLNIPVLSRIYGLSGKDFYPEDAKDLFNIGFDKINNKEVKMFDYLGKYTGVNTTLTKFFEPVTTNKHEFQKINAVYDDVSKKFNITGVSAKTVLETPKRLAPGHGACPGCGIPVNINLLLSGIDGNVVLLFQTGCSMVVTTAYPKTAFKVNFVHNLFQNGGATLSGLVEMFKEKQKRGEMPKEDITFIMVSGDGGLDIGLGSALATALRNHKLIIFEYDNGGYMNTGYQLSYSTPIGAKTATSHIGEKEFGKQFFHKDTPQIFASTNIPYVATVAESNLIDFIKKAKKAQEYSKNFGMAYVKALSSCPLNWATDARHERELIDLAVKSCYHPLYEVEQGITTITYNPETKNEKIPVLDWLVKMGRTKHLKNEKYADIVNKMQNEIDRRWEKLKAKHESPCL